jgi:predicted phage tail protein
MPAATSNIPETNASKGFQTAAFPVDNTNKVKVIFEDPTGKGAAIVIRNGDGRIEHSKNITHTNRYIGKFDLSPLPDGDYTVEIIPVSKAGLSKEKNSYSFQIQSTSTISRSLTQVNKQQERKLFTPKHFQVRR